MHYLSTDRAKERRSSPLTLAPWARSMLFLTTQYPSPLTPALVKPSYPTCGRIASYAWVPDYHQHIFQKMQTLITSLEKITNKKISSSCHIDTSPILERSLAAKCGLGWIGRNSNLINPQIGSLFFISECFLDIELEVENQIDTRDYCDSCKRCIHACPTKCILPNRTIDSRRCIAYLTIENKGIIPKQFRHFLGEWVFGCDICQMVCPWNKQSVSELRIQNISPCMHHLFPVLNNELTLTKEQFKEKYGDSSIARAQYSGFMRNLAVSAGCQQDEDSIPALISLMEREIDPLIRGHAVWALGCFNSMKILNILDKRLLHEQDAFVINEIQSVLDNEP